MDVVRECASYMGLTVQNIERDCGSNIALHEPQRLKGTGRNALIKCVRPGPFTPAKYRHQCQCCPTIHLLELG